MGAVPGPRRQLGLVAVFWSDSLHINQANVTERNHQVSLMAQIYRTAVAVKVWQGPGDNLSTEAFGYLTNIRYSPQHSTDATTPRESVERSLPYN